VPKTAKNIAKYAPQAQQNGGRVVGGGILSPAQQQHKPLKTRGLSINRASNRANMKYKEAVIKELKGGWVIEYYYYQEGQNPRIRQKLGINRIADLKERRREAKKIAENINILLRNGWNPFELKQEYSLRECLHIILEDVKANQRNSTYRDYKAVLNVFANWADLQGIGYVVTDLKAADFKRFIFETKTERNLSTRGINKYIQFLKAGFNRLVEYGIMEYNPIRLKQNKPTDGKKVPLTLDELRTIKEYLLKVHPRFWLFCEMIYHCGLRPIEVLRLRPSDIRDDNIVVYGSNAKNKKQQLASLPDFLREQLPTSGEFYIFGHHLTLEPMERPKAMDRNRVSEKWKATVKDKLGIDKDMYSIRHLSAVNHWKRHKDKSSLMQFLRHSSIAITETYMQGLVDFNIATNKDALERV
jgi:integrase